MTKLMILTLIFLGAGGVLYATEDPDSGALPLRLAVLALVLAGVGALIP